MDKNQLFAKKPLSMILAEMEGGHRLRRALGPVALTALGIGAIIGTGIFVLIGKAALTAGPALIVSFVVAGLACIFAALCYAEFASMAPVAGSAYTYAYVTLGELMAWIIGWDLILEYAVASAAVSHGWSKYFQSLLDLFGLKLPHVIADAPFDYNTAGKFVSTDAMMDLPAIIIALLLTGLLVYGIKESANFNAIMVGIKVSVVLFVIAVGSFLLNPDNWKPFSPAGFGGVTFFGIPIWGQEGPLGPIGMMAGAAIIFFAYLGFDAVSTQAEEAKNPKRDIPIGIIGSLLICTIFYIAVAAVLTGMVNTPALIEGKGITLTEKGIDNLSNAGFSAEVTNRLKQLEGKEFPSRDAFVDRLGQVLTKEQLETHQIAIIDQALPEYNQFKEAPVAFAFKQKNMPWARFLVTIGALTGMTSVLLVMMLGQPRILLAMARDGLLPAGFFASIHHRFHTPWKSTILTGIVVAAGGGLLPLNVLAELTNIGTLFAFVVVCSAVMVMRATDPHAERPFRVPLNPVTPIIGIVLCLVLMLSLPWENWVRLGVWLFVGFCIYFTYGVNHSKLRLLAEKQAEGAKP
jgi:APA family basic amino acid/polyamine antiporter